MSKPANPLKTRHKFLDFLYWNLVVSVPFITACIAIGKNSILWLISYIIICMLLVAVLYKFYCTHCPHYIQSDKTLKCMFFWGIPKFFKPESGPLSFLDKAVALVTTLIIVLLPVYWLWLQPGLLVIYLLSVGVIATTLKRYECRRCTYFQCPSNSVPEDLQP